MGNIIKRKEGDIGSNSKTRIFHQLKRGKKYTLAAIEEDKEFIE